MGSDLADKNSLAKATKDADEEVLSILLKIVDLNPNSDEVLETIRISGFELDKMRDLLTKQHPELCKQSQSRAEKVPPKREKTALEGGGGSLETKNHSAQTDNKAAEDKSADNKGVEAASGSQTSGGPDSSRPARKDDGGATSSSSLPRCPPPARPPPPPSGRPPPPPPPPPPGHPLKPKSSKNPKASDGVTSGSSVQVKGVPPKPPPFFKPPPKRGQASKGFGGALAGGVGGMSFESDASIGQKFADVDFGPAPPIGFEPKRLHWSVIPPNKIVGTIWEDIHSKREEEERNTNRMDDLKFDMDSILEQFFEDKNTLMQKLAMDCSNGSAFVAGGGASKKFRMVLDSKRSQNIEIALKALQLFDGNNELDLSPIKDMLGYTRRGLVGGIDAFLKGVSKERLKILLDLYPTPEEIKLLDSVKGEEGEDTSLLPLRSSEFFMLSILGLNRFKIRAQCVLAMKAFEEEYQSCLERLIKLEDAVVHIMSSLEKGGVLRQILRLILKIGNFLNHGTNRGKSYGFRFHSIELLKNVKSNNSKSNLLKYISKVVYDHSENMRQKVDVVSQVCSEAAPIDIADVYRDMEELEKSVSLIQDELKLFSSTLSAGCGEEEKEPRTDIRSEAPDKPNSAIRSENCLEISVFGVGSGVEKTIEELYLEIVETFVNNSSRKLEIAKKQLNEIIGKLNELQLYAGESQTTTGGGASRHGVSISASTGEIIKRCDVFFRLVKHEFNEFQAIEKKKKEKESRRLMGIRATKSSESLPSIKTSDHGLPKSSPSLAAEKQSQALSEFTPVHEIENFSPSNNMSDNSSSQLLLEISNVTLTSNSSTFSSSDSPFFQDQSHSKSRSGQVTPAGNSSQTPASKSNCGTDTQSSFSFSLHSGYDPISSSILRYHPNYFNNPEFCENKFAGVCNHSSAGIYDLNIVHPDPRFCYSSSSNCSLDQNTQSSSQHKPVNNNHHHQPVHLKSFFDTSSSTASIAAKVYDSQVSQSSCRSRNPKIDT